MNPKGQLREESQFFQVLRQVGGSRIVIGDYNSEISMEQGIVLPSNWMQYWDSFRKYTIPQNAPACSNRAIHTKNPNIPIKFGVIA